jgi:hypothetical protein
VIEKGNHTLYFNFVPRYVDEQGVTHPTYVGWDKYPHIAGLLEVPDEPTLWDQI